MIHFSTVLILQYICYFLLFKKKFFFTLHPVSTFMSLQCHAPSFKFVWLFFTGYSYASEAHIGLRSGGKNLPATHQGNSHSTHTNSHSTHTNSHSTHTSEKNTAHLCTSDKGTFCVQVTKSKTCLLSINDTSVLKWQRHCNTVCMKQQRHFLWIGYKV